MEPVKTPQDAGLGALLDFGFEKFVTLSVIKVVYVLGMGMIALMWLAALVSAFTQGGLAALVVLVVGPVIALVYLIFFRIWLELVVVIFRIGENTTKLVTQKETTVPPSPPAPLPG